MASTAVRVSEGRLVVDPVACKGIGLCSQLAPRLVDLDRWGFPVVPEDGLSTSEVAAARRAVRACPRRALALVTPEERHR